jgi:uncharacterized membrane protein
LGLKGVKDVQISKKYAWFAFLVMGFLGCDFFKTEDPNSPIPLPIVSEGAITGTLYAPALRIVNYYCADCHVATGHNELQHDAWKFAIRLDQYSEWAEASKVLLERLVPETAVAQDPPVEVMPNMAFSRKITQAERDTLVEWIKRGSPNTPSGE